MDSGESSAVCLDRHCGIRHLLYPGLLCIRIQLSIESQCLARRDDSLSVCGSVLRNDDGQSCKEPERRDPGRADGFVPAFVTALRILVCCPEYTGTDSLVVGISARNPLHPDSSQLHSSRCGMEHLVCADGHTADAGHRLSFSECTPDA